MRILGLVMLALVFLGPVLIWRTEPSRDTERAIIAWKRALEQAEISSKRGDLHGALNSYEYAARLTASVDDWRGLLAVACGLQKMGDSLEPAMNSHTVLTRAMLAAQRKQSTDGLETVATAFKATGEWFASLALSRIRESRFGKQMARDLKSETCWPTAERNERSP